MQANTLLKQLQRLLPLAQGNKVIPATSCFKYDGNDKWYATDMRNTAILTHPTELPELCVDAAQFVSILKGFGDRDVALEHKDNTLTIKSGRSKYSIPTLPGQDFPIPPSVTGDGFKVITKRLHDAIEATAFAVSTDDLRPAMGGIYFNMGETVTTDAHKMVIYKHGIGLTFILPVQTARLVSAQASEFCMIYESAKNIQFEFDDITIIGTKIDEKYPDYKAVIPAKHEATFKFEVSDMLGVLQRLVSVSNRQTSAVVLELSTEGCKMYANDMDLALEGHEEIDGTYMGSNMKIGFNAKYFIQCLQYVPDETVTLELIAPNRAGLIQCADRTILLMPLMIN